MITMINEFKKSLMIKENHSKDFESMIHSEEKDLDTWDYSTREKKFGLLIDALKEKSLMSMDDKLKCIEKIKYMLDNHYRYLPIHWKKAIDNISKFKTYVEWWEESTQHTFNNNKMVDGTIRSQVK